MPARPDSVELFCGVYASGLAGSCCGRGLGGAGVQGGRDPASEFCDDATALQRDVYQFADGSGSRLCR